MKAMGPYFDWIARISAVIGILLMVIGAGSALTGVRIFKTAHLINYFIIADSFFLVTIALFIDNIKHKKD
jgi:hypothetical protein